MRKTLSLPAAIALGALLFTGCATALKIEGTSRSPSTEALLKIEGDSNGNSVITIETQHLPPPVRLGGGFKTYVVWIISPNNTLISNVGMLNVDESQRGRITVTSPLPEFLFQITAEESGFVTTPGNTVVLEGAAKR